MEALSSQEQRQAALAAFDGYCNLYGKQLRWTTNPATGRWKRLKNGPVSYAQPKEWLPGRHPQSEWSFVYHGGELHSDATDIVFYSCGEPFYGVNQHCLSMVMCRFPLADFFAGKFSIQSLLTNWCATLQPWAWPGRAIRWPVF